MNYEKLCLRVRGYGKEKRVPAVRDLLKSDIPVVFSTSEDILNGLTIFASGHVVYGEEGRMTVFAIVTFWFHQGVLDETNRNPTKEHMCDPSMNRTDVYGIPTWVYLLCAFGRKRLQHTEEVRLRLSFSSNYEQLMDYRVTVPSYEEEYCEKEMIKDLLSCLTKNQRRVVVLYYFEGYTYEQISEILNAIYLEEFLSGKRKKRKTASRQAVCQMVLRALERMREKMEKDY